MIRPVFRAMAILATVLFGTAALAEVTLSASNNPAIDLDARVSALFGAERDTLDAYRSRGLTGLVKTPDAKTLRGGAESLTRAALDRLPPAGGGAEWRCLSEALYFEARGETLKGIFGVAEVILNRVDDPHFPKTVCGVVNQGTGERFRCQFTYTCDGRPEVIGEERAFRLVGKIARLMLDGAPRRLTGGATYYHTKSVRPRWSTDFERTTTIGVHHFYRSPDRMASG